jgi:hypothetical protein
VIAVPDLERVREEGGREGEEGGGRRRKEEEGGGRGERSGIRERRIRIWSCRGPGEGERGGREKEKGDKG